MKKFICITLFIVLSLTATNPIIALASNNIETEKILIDTVKKYTSTRLDSEETNKIVNSNKTNEEKAYELEQFLSLNESSLNSYKQHGNYEDLINNEKYVAYLFKKDLNNDFIKRQTINLSALIFNDEVIDYIVGNYPEKDKYKQMLKDYMKENKNYFECLTYSNEIQSILNDSIIATQDIIKKDELTKLYCSIENATTRNDIDKIVFDTISTPIFKEVDEKYIFRSNMPKALNLAGDTLTITATTLNGIQDICYAVSNIETYKMYETFLKDIYSYKKDGKYMMPYALRCAAYDLHYEMQGNFQAITGNIIPLLKEYTKFGVDKVIDVTELTTTGALSSITAGLSIGKFIGNVVLGMDVIVKSAAYVEGYAYLGELYCDMIKKSRDKFLKKPTIVNAENFKKQYITLSSIREKGEKTYLEMLSFKDAWAKDYLKSWTGYEQREAVCNENLKEIRELRFLVPNITISHKKISFLVGDSFTFKATKEAINEDIVWTVSNNKLASINSKTGKFIAKKVGTVTVTVKSEKYSASCKIKINENPNKYYANFLKTVHDNPKNFVDLYSDATNIKAEIEKNQFAIVDIDQDGEDELIISFTNTYMGAMYTGIWKFNEENNKVEHYQDLNESCHFFSNGIVKVDISHNQGPSLSVWPYDLLRYDSEKNKYIQFASAYSIDKEWDSTGKLYSKDKDKDGDGVLYFFEIKGETSHTLTSKEYQAYVNKYIPPRNEIKMNWRMLTYKNINAI